MTEQTFKYIINKKTSLQDTDYIDEKIFLEARQKARASPETAN